MWTRLTNFPETVSKRINLLRWIDKGFWSVMDQGLFSGSNFLLNVLLARWLLPESYATFTLVFSIFLLVGAYHTAILTEPMLVFGPGKYKKRLVDYLSILLQGHIGFALLGSFLLGVAGLLAQQLDLAELFVALFGLALAQPFMLFLWLVRRACYVSLNPRLATLGGASYLVLIVVGLGFLYRQAWLSSFSALSVMGLASLVTGLWITRRLGVRSIIGVDGELRTGAVKEHWQYGRWSVGTSLLMWIPGNIYFFLLPIWGGLEATAALRALQNLVLPVLHFLSALGLILLPSLVKAREQTTFKDILRLNAILFTGISLLYWILLGLSYRPVLNWLYKGQYLEYGGLLWLLGLSPLLYGFNLILGGALRALERPDRVFWSYGVSTVVALVGGLVCVALWALPGAAVSNLLSSLATVVVMFLIWPPSKAKST